MHRHLRMTRTDLPQITSDRPFSEKPMWENQEPEDELLKRAIAMSLERDAQEDEEAIDLNQMTEEEKLEYAMKLSMR